MRVNPGAIAKSFQTVVRLIERGGPLAVQGLYGNTLVAGKTTAFRCFADANLINSVATVDGTLTVPGGGKVNRHWDTNPPNDIFGWNVLVKVSDPTFGSSVVVRHPGSELHTTGDYQIDLSLRDANGKVLLEQSGAFSLDTTNDLRVAVARIWSGGPLSWQEIYEAHAALLRMSYVLPVRDGISTFDGDTTCGLRYVMDLNPYPYDGNLGPFFDQWIGRPPGEDSADVGIAFRFPTPGKGSGGNENHDYHGMPFSVIVWGAPLAHVFAHETGHALGLEPAQDPHWIQTSAHSKDTTIDLLARSVGFDVQFNQPFPDPTFDIMFPSGPDPEPPDVSHAYNTWDWEYLRQALAKLPSTGPA